MRRYCINIEYDGANYTGWQRQKLGKSVQRCLVDAIYKLTGERVIVTGAGRTDAGVHALGQVAHFDLLKRWNALTIISGMNNFLRTEKIAVLNCVEVAQNFHARFSAIERSYVYKIITRRAPLILDANRAWHVRRRLDAEKMNQVAQILLGTHDFSSFRSVKCQSKSAIRTINEIEVNDVGDGKEFHVGQIFIRIKARSFLHNQVRIIVGSLWKIGCGKWGIEDFRDFLLGRNRAEGAQTAPAHGLYLEGIEYPDMWRM